MFGKRTPGQAPTGPSWLSGDEMPEAESQQAVRLSKSSEINGAWQIGASGSDESESQDGGLSEVTLKNYVTEELEESDETEESDGECQKCGKFLDDRDHEFNEDHFCYAPLQCMDCRLTEYFEAEAEAAAVAEGASGSDESESQDGGVSEVTLKNYVTKESEEPDETDESDECQNCGKVLDVRDHEFNEDHLYNAPLQCMDCRLTEYFEAEAKALAEENFDETLDY